MLPVFKRSDMSWQQSTIQVDEETVRVQCGPMLLNLKVFDRSGPRIDVARLAGRQAVSLLVRVAQAWPRLRRPAADIQWQPADNLVRTMIAAARAVGEPDLTPMAAVAGALADGVADWLLEQGMTRVMVDNGGDLAIRLGSGQTIRVGVRTDLGNPHVTHLLQLDDREPSWGVTTSGLGGRSFTRGIASAVTVVARRASIADAASTAIANACRISDPGIRQIPAGLVDPSSDIPDLPVTVAVEGVSEAAVARAVDLAVRKSDALTGVKLIFGSLIAAGRSVVVTRGMENFLMADGSGPHRQAV